MTNDKLDLAGPNGPRVLNAPLSPDLDTFHSRIHSNFKYGVFPYWKPESEVIALNYGVMVLAALPAIPAAATVNRMFNLHKMQNYRYSRLPPVLAAGGVSTALTFVTQTLLVEGDIITSKCFNHIVFPLHNFQEGHLIPLDVDERD